MGWNRRGESIGSATGWTVFWVVTPSIAAALCLLAWIRTRAVESAHAAAAVTVARMLATRARVDGAHGSMQTDDLCTQLICDPAVLAAWVLDGSNRVLASARRSGTVDGRFARQPLAPNAARRVSVPARIGRPPAAGQLVDVPLSERASGNPRAHLGHNDVTLRLLLVLPAAPAPAAPPFQWAAAGLVAAGGLSTAIGLFRLRRGIVRPLILLSAAARDEVPAVPGRLAERRDEIGDVARAISSLHRNRKEWQARTEQSARSVDSRVARDTHAMRTELRRAQRQIWIDPLTGLNNRRVLQNRLQPIFDTQRHAGRDLSLVMLDIDNFKALNDTLGHPAGDRLLKFTADLIRGGLRADDVAIRYGGDEFLLVFPWLSAVEARTIAARLVALFGQRARVLPLAGPRPSLSAGIASLVRHRPANADELVALADEALYEAKKRRGERVCICREHDCRATSLSQ